MNTPPVVVLSHWFDPTADWVVNELNRREIPVFRSDVADFPQRLTMTAELSGAWTTTLRMNGRTVELGHVSGLYYRRPTGFEFPDDMSEPVRRWATGEARIGFGGLLSTSDRWLNHPSAIAHAEYKPVQLHHAAAVGLNIPRTMITNEPAQAETFARRVGEVIYKPMTGAPITDDDQNRLIYANRVAAADLNDPSISLTAHMIQEWIEHTHAVRVTIVDHAVFAAAIHADTEAGHIDWRSDYAALHYEEVCVPKHVEDAALRLMAALNLRFGALDFLVGPAGWTFLEINPNGQWAWIEELTPRIAAAIANALTKDTPNRAS